MVILTLVGPRPQIIKEAALQMYLNTTPDTAWKELIGWNILSYDNIFVPDVCIEFRADIYGAGNTAEQIINILRTS